MDKPEEFPQEFLDARSASGSVGSSKENKMEICIGEKCNEKRFLVGSNGSGSIGLLTYCSDCYLSALNKHAATIDVPPVLIEDLTVTADETKEPVSDADAIVDK